MTDAMWPRKTRFNAQGRRDDAHMAAATDENARWHDFCLRYFTHVGATLLPAPPGVLCVELPREVDKELTDRPFYWMWVEAMKENPPKTVLYLKFDPDAPERGIRDGAKPELITPGCYRFMRILASAKSRGSFAVGYEDAPCVTPFSVVSVKVSYVCDRRQDFLESYAVDLRDLRVYPDAIKRLESRTIQDERPRATQIVPVPYDLDQLFSLVEDRVKADIGRRDQTWAREAERRLADELARLDAYYSSLEQEASRYVQARATPSSCRTARDPRPESGGGGVADGAADAAGPVAEAPDATWSSAAERELRRAEIVWRTEPKIVIRPTQFALVYLSRPPAEP